MIDREPEGWEHCNGCRQYFSDPQDYSEHVCTPLDYPVKTQNLNDLELWARQNLEGRNPNSFTGWEYKTIAEVCAELRELRRAKAAAPFDPDERYE